MGLSVRYSVGEGARSLLQTVSIATLGTAVAVLLALPVAFLVALNTTFNRGTYLLA